MLSSRLPRVEHKGGPERNRCRVDGKLKLNPATADSQGFKVVLRTNGRRMTHASAAGNRCAFQARITKSARAMINAAAIPLRMRELFPSLRNQKKLSCVWIFNDGSRRKTGDIDILSLLRCIRTRDHAFPAWDRNSIGQTNFCFFHIRG